MKASIPKPIILCPMARMITPGVIREYVNQPYLRAIVKAGGIPFPVTPASMPDVDQLFRMCHGVLLQGGEDINPAVGTYGLESEDPKYDNERDQLEFDLARRAYKFNKPFLGICRGFQMMTLALSGTMFQDLASERPHLGDHNGDKTDRSKIAHEVLIDKNTLLHRILEVYEIGVNSTHHQGVQSLGTILYPSAQTSDGLIEAAEAPKRDFYMGTQFHPEELTDPVWKNLFKAFVNEARFAVNL